MASGACAVFFVCLFVCLFVVVFLAAVDRLPVLALAYSAGKEF
jgi:hypothetical protein